MSDQFTTRYQELLEGQYDCNALSTLAPVDRFVINAWLPGCATGGGFRNWWRSLYGSDDNLDDTHLMRMAGHFSRRLRGFAKANHISVIDCFAARSFHDLGWTGAGT